MIVSAQMQRSGDLKWTSRLRLSEERIAYVVRKEFCLNVQVLYTHEWNFRGKLCVSHEVSFY